MNIECNFLDTLLSLGGLLTIAVSFTVGAITSNIIMNKKIMKIKGNGNMQVGESVHLEK